jgi:predicted TPR repeat methyltransferase
MTPGKSHLTRYAVAKPGTSAKNPMHASLELFDGQAGLFERRAGLPETVCCAIAKKVIEIGEANAGDLIVEVGSGTGQIGQWFEAPVRYAGFDLSAGMLKECSHRLDLIQ